MSDDYGDDVHIVETNPASNTALVASDFGNITFTSLGSLALSSFGIEAYGDITITDLSKISLTGITKLGFIMGKDLNNDEPTTLDNENFLGTYSADWAGTAKDPKLVVVHSAARTTGRGRTKNLHRKSTGMSVGLN